MMYLGGTGLYRVTAVHKTRPKSSKYATVILASAYGIRHGANLTSHRQANWETCAVIAVNHQTKSWESVIPR